MAQIFKNCTSCKKLITIFSENKTTLCKHCGTEFETDSLLDESEKTFIKSLSSNELDISLKYNSMIMQGNEHILNNSFDKAEESFKQAIDLCENRYEGYYGVVRAKTHDFKILPDTNDYLEYAKIAISIADDDVDSIINANLAKINIFKNKK